MTNEILLRWRTNLQSTSTVDADGPCVHLEDPMTGKFFRIGADELSLLSRFDGRRSWRAITEDANHQLGPRAFSEQEAQGIIQWACQRRLLVAADHSETGIAHRVPSQSRWSLLSIRIPLGCPDRWCAKVLPSVNWLFGKPAFIVWLILLAWAAGEMTVEWDRFVTSSAAILVPTNWLRLGVAWLVLKVIHETAHALVCKRHGGEVREVGFALLFFAPVAYVDVTSCWRFASRWPRIHTAVAGMYAELACAALVVLISGQLDSPEQQHFLDNVALMASVTTLLFNLNPLSKFDGYFVLADLCGLTNLYARGRHAAGQLLRRWLTGSLSAEPLAPWLAAYGIATWLWSVTIMVGMIVAASLYWHGLGLILAMCIGWNWLSSLARQAMNWLHRCNGRERTRFVVRSTLVTALVVTALLLTPWPFAPSAPGVVEFSPLVVVRADSAGFVTRVLVEEGEAVVEGQPLLELQNEELERERQDLELAIEQSRLRERLAAQQQDTAAVQVEQQQGTALQRRLSERHRQTDRLTLRAPISGVVLSRQLSQLPGSFIKEGSEVLSIGNPAHCEFVAAVSQDDAPSLPQSTDQPVFVHLHGRGDLAGRVQRIHPRASTNPEHLCLCAPFGGPLPVRAISEEATSSPKSSPSIELLKPHLRLTITLTPSVGRRLRAGELGWVRWERSQSCAETLWQHARSMLVSVR